MRPCGATRAGTQAPPLPNSIIFFHAIPHKQNNHLRVIYPNETNHPHAIHPNETVGAVPVCPPERPRSGVSIREIGFVHHALCAGNERWMRPCRATRAGTQAPPLPIPVIFFHAIPHKQHNHLRVIHPTETNRPYQTPSYFSTQSHTNKITIYAQSSQTTSTAHAQSTPNETVGAVPVCPPERPRSGVSIRKWMNTTTHTSGAEMHRALPPPFFKTSCVCKLASR